LNEELSILRLNPRGEIVEGDAQRGSELRKRGEAAGLAPGFDFAEIAGRDPRCGRERLPREAAVSPSDPRRMLASAETAHQLDRR